MVFSIGVIPVISVLTLIAGVVVLIWPKIINYAIGIYLVLVGLLGILGSVY